MRIIPTRIHGIIDYLVGILFIILPKVLNWNQTADYLLSILGVSIIVYSLLTHYELSVVKWIPMPVHLGLDVLAGLFLIAAPFFFPVAGDGVTTWMVILGLFALIISLFSQIEPPERARTGDGAHTSEGVGVYDASRR